HMIVAWKMKDSKPFAHVALIEHADEFTWKEDELRKLYYEDSWWFREYNDTITVTVSDMWLIDDNMTLKTVFRAKYAKRNFELSICISEKEKDDFAIRPLCIDLGR